MRLKNILKINKNQEFSTATIDGNNVPMQMTREAVAEVPFLSEKYIWEFFTVGSVMDSKLGLILSEVSLNRLTDGHFGTYNPKLNEGTAEYYYQKFSVFINGIGEVSKGSYGMYSFEIPSGNNVNGGGTLKKNVKKQLTEGAYSNGVISLENGTKVTLDSKFRKYLKEFSAFNKKSETNISYHLRAEADIMNVSMGGEAPITANDVIAVLGVFGPQSTAFSALSAMLHFNGKHLARRDKLPVIVDNIKYWHYTDPVEKHSSDRPWPGYSNTLVLDKKEERAPNKLINEPLLDKIKEFTF